MESRAGIAEPHVPRQWIPLSSAFWLCSLASDALSLFGVRGLPWKDVALWTMVAGLAGALAAAVTHYLDHRALTDPFHARSAERRLTIRVAMILLFLVNVVMRLATGPQALAPVALSVLGVVVLGVSGWLGGEPAPVYGVAVDDRPREAESSAFRRRAA